MVQLVIKMRDRGSVVAQDQFLVTGMRGRGRQRQPIGEKQHVQRVRRHHQQHEQRGQVEQVLDRVHRKAGPGADGNVAVMYRVKTLVQRFEMQQAMHAVEMERLPHRDQRE